MSEFDDERDVSRLYRHLPDEQPAAAVDAAIRAQARVVAGTVPAPLVPPTGRRRWYFPLAAAAVIVLAVAVTWHVERAQPEGDVAELPQSPPAAKEQVASAPQVVPAPAEAERRQAAPQKRKGEKSAEPARDAAESLAKQREEAAPPTPPAPARADEAQPRLGAAARSESRAMIERKAETPEQWLERIARLRGEGRHEEADKALAEFRRRYPDFKLSTEMREKVEKK